MNRLQSILFLALLLLLNITCSAQRSSKSVSQVKTVKSNSSHRAYDFVVPRDGNIREALAMANDRKDTLKRFTIFVEKGVHVSPCQGMTKGGDGQDYPDPRLHLRAPRVSIIGEDRDQTIITNTCPPPTWDNGFGQANPLEGIGNGDVLILEREAHDCYFQDITIKSGMADKTGRNIALHDRSNHTICNNVCLWGYQDTYVSNNQHGVFYFKGGIIRGRTDYICGKGDVLFDQVTFQQCGTGGYICAPSVPLEYGYVMDHCTIKCETPDVTYYMGRPWGSATPTAYWLHTTVDKETITHDKRGYNGWADMGSKGWPARFAEYDTRLVDGTVLNLEGRRNAYTDMDGNVHPNNPILTPEEANAITHEKVLHHWKPTIKL